MGCWAGRCWPLTAPARGPRLVSGSFWMPVVLLMAELCLAAIPLGQGEEKYKFSASVDLTLKWE